MLKSVKSNQQCFWEALAELGQEKHYNVSWKDGELIICSPDKDCWRVAVIDEVKQAFVHFEVCVSSDAGSTTMEKEGYYLPGLSADTAERIILNCVSEASKYTSVGNHMMVCA